MNSPGTIERRWPRALRRLLLAWVLAAAIASAAGCGGSSSDGTSIPDSTPPGAIAVVGTTAVARASFDRWLPIVEHLQDAPHRARARTVTYLLKAQWLIQEADAEGINQAALGRLVARQVAGPSQAPDGLTQTDRAFEARLGVIAEALQQRHSHAPGKASAATIRRYYRVHRDQFRIPAVRHTLMVVTRTRGAALEAEAALRRGRPWRDVAKRFSVDSSALLGGRFAIAADGAHAPVLQHAAFAAPLRSLVGPLRAPTASTPKYFLFEVIGGTPARLRTLLEVKPQIRQALDERRRHEALVSFERSFVRRWRQRTFCAPGFVVPECRNYDRDEGS